MKMWVLVCDIVSVPWENEGRSSDSNLGKKNKTILGGLGWSSEDPAQLGTKPLKPITAGEASSKIFLFYKYF